ncbi:MAG: SufB/SufD family protein [Candidatus Enteromonas sp.]
MERQFVDLPSGNFEFTVERGESARLLFVFFEKSVSQKISLHVKEDATLEVAYADFGRGKSNIDADIYLEEEGAKASFHGAFLASEKDLKEVKANCFHLAPHTEGLVENYGITEGQSRLLFLGKSDIQRGAKGSITRQAAKAIVFDPKCVAHASPILCIDENDVQASHAAAVGKLNDEHLFYLLSRGIDLREARRLITLGYLKPIKEYFDGELKERIDAAIEGGV